MVSEADIVLKRSERDGLDGRAGMEPCLNAAWGSGALGEGGVSGVTVEAVDPFLC